MLTIDMKCRQSVVRRCTTIMWLPVLILLLGTCKGQTGGDTAGIISEPRSVPVCKITPKNGMKVLTCSNHFAIPQSNDSVFNSDKPVEINALIFARNSLTKLNENEFSSTGLLNLKDIDLSENQIDQIHADTFSHLELLRQLDLSKNKITNLPLDAFSGLSNLKILKLSGNPIYKFTGNMFPPSRALTDLDLSHCEIRELPKQIFQNLAGLQQLLLNGNKLERLNWELFKSNNVLSTLRLENNPWNCNCHVKFLRQFFAKWLVMPIDLKSIACASPEQFNGSTWKDVQLEELVCQPSVQPLQASLTNLESGDHIGVDQIFMGYGKDVAFECVIEAYPKPDIKWLKDGKDLELIAGEGSLSRHLGGVGDKSHFRLEDRSMDNQDESYAYEYRKLLRIYRTELNDMGTYTCVAKDAASDFSSSASIYLNFTAIPWTTTAFPMLSGSTPLWIWLLIPLGLGIIIGLLLICIYFWKTRENKRQQALKEQMLNKFTGSHTVLDDGSVNHRSPIRLNGQTNGNRKTEDCDPLLTPAGTRAGSAVRGSNRSLIPDVARGNPEFVRSLSPEVFSPRPLITAQQKREFFARQMSEPPMSPARNSSVMSLHPYNSNRRPMHAIPQFYSQTHLPPYSSQTLHGRHVHPQAFPMQQIRRPGSAMSLITPPPDPIYGVSQARPQFTRQYSAGAGFPSYATMRHNRIERPPSISSYTSEPPMPLESLYGSNVGGYVTLPRNHGYSTGPFPRADSGFGRSLSPTGSTYSNSSVYSTLPRHARFNKTPQGGIVYDSVGPRTTADGGSSLSLNKIGESPGPIQSKMNTSNPLDDINNGLMSPINGKVRSTKGRLGSATTPGSLRGRNDFFSFEPIQEVDDSLSKLSNTDIDQILLPKIHTPRSTLDSNNRYKKKKPSPIVNIPPKNLKPSRTFDYAKSGNSNFNGDPNKTLQDAVEAPSLPTSPIPKKPPRSIGSLENIYEEPILIGNTEGTEV